MPGETKKRLLAWAYALGAAVRETLRAPRWLPRAARKAAATLRQGGWRGLERQVFDVFLPRRFRAKTRIALGGPSDAVYRKFPGLVHPPEAQVLFASARAPLRAPVRILVVRSAAMGDVLMATPIVRKLFEDRRGFARIDVATRYGEIFANSPYVRQVLDPKRLADRPQDYDLVIQLDGSYERNPAMHIVDAYGLHAFGSMDFDRQLQLFPDAASRARAADAAAALGGRYIVVHKPDHAWPNRNLPATLWRDLLARIVEGCDHQIVQIGGPDDAAFDFDARLHDHRQRYSLHELQALIAGASAYVGVDAGPLHVAATTTTPIAAFFTSAHHEFRRPLRRAGAFVPITPDIPCYGCQASNPPPGTHYLCRRDDNACVRSFDAAAAADQVLALLR